jgi:hypothetical protein
MESGKLQENQFLELLTSNFPLIKDDVYDEDWKGLIHLQIACFARYTNNRLEANDLAEVHRCFEFFEEIIDKVNAAINNALFVSYLEHINMEEESDTHVKARKFLNPEHLQAWKDLTGN